MKESAEKTNSVPESGQATCLYLVSALVKDGPEDLKAITKVIEESGAKIRKAEDLGKKTLAYPIAKQTELFLISVFFDTHSGSVPALDKQLRQEERMVRYLLSRWNDDPDRTSKTQRAKRERVTHRETSHV